MIEQLLLSALSSYAITFVVTSSSLFEPFREWFAAKYPKLRIGNNKHYIECRMCFGATATVALMLLKIDFTILSRSISSKQWMLAIKTICHDQWLLTLPIYGLSYFLATQERN